MLKDFVGTIFYVIRKERYIYIKTRYGMYISIWLI